MSERDPFELLRDLNPLAALEQTLPTDDALLADILATPLDRPLDRPRAKRRWWWTGVGLGVIALGATTYAVLRSEPAKNPTIVSCYSDAAVEPVNQQVLGAVKDPIAACRDAWASGAFGPAEVPELTGCVTSHDIVAVVPGDREVCERLGLVLWNGVINDEGQRIIAFTDEYTETIGSTCYPQADATRIAKDLLAKYGLDDWQVASNDNWTDASPCTAPGFNPLTKTVTIGARPRLPSDKNQEG